MYFQVRDVQITMKYLCLFNCYYQYLELKDYSHHVSFKRLLFWGNKLFFIYLGEVRTSIALNG